MPDSNRQSSQVNPAELRRVIVDHLGLGQLKDLYFDLGVEDEDTTGTLGDMARELVKHLMRQGRLAELVETCKKLYPGVSWNEALEDVSKDSARHMPIATESFANSPEPLNIVISGSSGQSQVVKESCCVTTLIIRLSTNTERVPRVIVIHC